MVTNKRKRKRPKRDACLVFTQRKSSKKKWKGTLADYYLIGSDLRTLKDWCQRLKLSYEKVLFRIAELGWEFEEAIQPIEDKLISHEGATKTLKDWCDLYDLKLPAIAIRILRGELFENIVKE